MSGGGEQQLTDMRENMFVFELTAFYSSFFLSFFIPSFFRVFSLCFLPTIFASLSIYKYVYCILFLEKKTSAKKYFCLSDTCSCSSFPYLTLSVSLSFLLCYILCSYSLSVLLYPPSSSHLANGSKSLKVKARSQVVSLINGAIYNTY